MAKSVGIRMDEDLLKKLNEMGEEENLDRSTLVRKLLRRGYELMKKEQAAKKYVKGEITITKAAEEAEVTIWEMEKFLVGSGYKSEYSLKDLEKEASTV